MASGASNSYIPLVPAEPVPMGGYWIDLRLGWARTRFVES